MGGSKPGERRGGRQKGVPNRVTNEARAAFCRMFERLGPDLEGWIRREAEDEPGKAAALVLSLAEYHIPKLGRLEHVGDGGGPLRVIFKIEEN